MNGEFTLSQYLDIYDGDPTRSVTIGVDLASSAEELLGPVEDAIDYLIRQMVHYRQYKVDLSEDQKNAEIVQGLNTLGIPARLEAAYGGHCDISIEMRHGFLWLGEAKNWKGVAWAYKGFRQLITRYATGLPGEQNGGLIFYFSQQSCASLLAKWRLDLSKCRYWEAEVEEVNPLTFRSKHTHKGSGTPFSIRHTAVPLYFKPEDS